MMPDLEVDHAHGGAGWRPRGTDHVSELGQLWRACGANSEFARLTDVLLYRPGQELDEVVDAKSVDWNEVIDGMSARNQIETLAEIYRTQEVCVHFVEGGKSRSANQMFMRDSFVMTPGGAIVCRLAG